jgi:hypothetical protein
MQSGSMCYCQCPIGFTGQYCQTCNTPAPTTQAPNPCNGYVCQNGGTPMQSGNMCFCQCRQGYAGQYCETCTYIKIYLFSI